MHTPHLIDNARQLEAFLALSPDGIVVVDHAALIVQVNEPLLELTEYDQQDLVGQPIEILVPPRFRGAHVEHRDGFTRAATIRPMGVGRDLWLRTKSRREVAVDIALRPLQLEEGQVVAAVIRDVSSARATERQLVEAQQRLHGTVDALSAANARLESAAAFQREFISTASHELRTPLTAVAGFAETLIDRWDELTEDRRREAIKAVLRNARRQLSLVDDLAHAARIQTGNLKLRMSQVDVPAAVNEAITTVAGADAFELDLAPTTAWADEGRLIQIVINLVTNALRYGRAPYRVVVDEDADDVRIVVEDRGDGVPPEFAARMFEAFAQAGARGSQPNPGRAKGTGLGLYICRSLALAMDGDIDHRAHPDGGAVFEIHLPARAPGTVAAASTDP